MKTYMTRWKVTISLIFKKRSMNWLIFITIKEEK